MLKNNKGETIVEVLISLALIGVTITAAYVSIVTTFHNIQYSQQKQDAVSLAKSQIEQIAASSTKSTVPTTCYEMDSYSNCTSSSAPHFVIAITKLYSNDPDYKITVTWKTPSNSNAAVTMYYTKRIN
jgi:type II secretory pathway pseudopilin PulG